MAKGPKGQGARTDNKMLSRSHRHVSDVFKTALLINLEGVWGL
jgi:hypothetical protein